MLRDRLPPPVRASLTRLRSRARDLKDGLTRARTAFAMPEYGSRLHIGSFSGFEVAYREDTADEGVIGESFDRDIFFAGVPEYTPKPNHVILDIGAHIGTFTLLAASLVPEGRVYAVEASRETHAYLRVNLALNDVPNVEAFHLALAGSPGEVTLYHDAHNWGHSITKRYSRHGERVRAETLPAFLDAQGIGRVDFVKFNCEGAEFAILFQTPREVLERFQRLLVLYHCDLVEGADLDALSAHLEDAGLRVDVRNRSFVDGAERGWLIADRTGFGRTAPADVAT